MTDYYIKYYDLLEDPNTHFLLKCIVYDENTRKIDLMSTKENVEELFLNESINKSLLKTTRSLFIRYLHYVWLQGIPNAPAEWWCEMWPMIKKLIILSTCMEALVKEDLPCINSDMEIPQVLLKLWDFITSQQASNNWSYIRDEYDKLCKKHNDLRELFFF